MNDRQNHIDWVSDIDQREKLKAALWAQRSKFTHSKKNNSLFSKIINFLLRR
jgi:hypothetical protein